MGTFEILKEFLKTAARGRILIWPMIFTPGFIPINMSHYIAKGVLQMQLRLLFK